MKGPRPDESSTTRGGHHTNRRTDGNHRHANGRSSHGYISDKDRYLARLKRIEGQTRGIHRMIDEDTYCIDILAQVSAVTAALENVALALLDDHLRHCVVAATKAGGPEADKKIHEATSAIARLVKS